MRFRADAGTREELIAVADAGTKMDGHGIHQHVVVADDGVLVNIAERADDVAVAQLCFGVNKC